GDHVSGVLHVAWRIGDDELSPRRREVSVSNVDGDVLLAFGTETVRQQRQIHVIVAALLGRALDSLELILEDGFGVVEEPPDQGALSIVYAPRRGEAEEVEVVVRRHATIAG